MTRLIHRICKGSRGSGIPRNGATNISQSSLELVVKQVFHELADVVVDDTAFLDGGHNGREVVVEQHHVGGLFRHVAAGDAHGHADVRSLQRRRVVDTVARHGDDVAALAQGLDDLELVLRRHAREDAHIAHSVGQLSGSSVARVRPRSECDRRPRCRAHVRCTPAVSGWSPVIMTGRMPAATQVATASRASGRGGSRMPTSPTKVRFLLDVLVGPVIGEPIEQAERHAEHTHPVAGEAVIRAHDPGRPLLVESLAALAHPHVSRDADQLVDATLRECDVTSAACRCRRRCSTPAEAHSRAVSSRQAR